MSEGEGIEANLECITRHRFSRYLYLDRQGAVQGMVHLKDVFLALQGSPQMDSLRPIVRPALVVRPSLAAIKLFRKFQLGSPHFAIVADHDGHPMGFITMDNLLGALVGEIRDEFLQTKNEWARLDDGSLIGKGSLPIFTLERALGIDIEATEVDSIGGLIQHQLRDLPKEGQRIAFPQFDVVVKKMKGPKIVLVRIFPGAI
ncbi:MAG: hypothetical protein KJ558_06705 [Gammaproteobacteria bacterium]|nr:hypothetical protein [Gammaproteobacteria bacterium]MBU1654508.1 hypothetical protein [Gammaproteobacteria bacterium]MBU1961326.1 hypothetical protein [Gammaproteobacteria bacterium]